MERVYVAVRARPLLPEESRTSPWRISGNSIFLANQPTKFDFDRIFGEVCETVDVFESRTKEIVASVVRGFNGTVFAYGQTSSGKTYTMRGSINEPGIIPLSVHELFCSIQAEMDREFLVRMSYMEIYNEEINDLLAPEHRKLQIHESLERGIYVAGLKEEIVTSPEQVLQLMEFGESHRHIGQTNMNFYSSRSHTIFRMIVESRDRNEEGGSINCFDAVRVSILNLVDLAGSERAVKTGAEGIRLKEGSHINKSLMTLGTVIKKLSDGAENQGGHVPYRDSKLTRILQPAIGGNSNTAMICNITLSQIHADETKSSLLFASRALQIRNCACVNEILTDAALLKRQKKEIEELRTKLLSSHSEHLEEEILNLRNTLLQSALEKERIALELEEEKKGKAHRERRLLEQAKKIENLSSMILYSERDTTHSNKTKRRETWCPGPFQKKSTDEVSNLEIDIMESVEEEPEISLPCPFSKAIQESEAPAESIPFRSLLPDIADNTYKTEDFSLPDAHALLNVTSRRKNHQNRSSRPLEGDQLVEKLSKFGELCLENDAKMKRDMIKESKTICSRSESTPTNKCDASSIGHLTEGVSVGHNNCPGSEFIPSYKCDASSTGHLTEGVSVGHNNLTVRESKAILVIKHLEKQIEALEMEKTSVQVNLDSVVTLATEQNASLREKCNELQQDVRNALEEARTSNKQLRLSSTTQHLVEEFNGATISVISTAIVWIASDFVLLWNAFDNVLAVTEEVIQFLTILSEMLLSFKILPRQCMLQLKSIVLGHESINNFMSKKFKEVEFEKNLLSNQLREHQKQICELKTDFENREKVTAEQGLQYDMEKNELLSQVLCLQREVSQLSSSSLARENETLRKEHDKRKLKLKDTECKLKNIIHDKVKLEGEKAQAERKIKSLQDQCAILERDILKRDSQFDRTCESRSEFNKAKVRNAVVQQSLQNDYQRLEFSAFEMEAENSSLKEALEIAFAEKEEAFVKNEIIESELEAMAKKLNTTYFDMELLTEDLLRMEQRAADFESSSRRLEDSLNLLSREKEEMILQLTEALLEVEAEKSAWAFQEKTQSEKLKISNDEIVKLSENLLEVREELEFCKDQCNGFRERLCLSEENTKREKDASMAKSLEINKLRDELNRIRVDADGNGVARSNLELTLTQYHPASAEVQNLRSALLRVTRERDALLSKIEQLRRLEADIDVFERKYDDLQSNTEFFYQQFNQRISSFEVEIQEEGSLSNKEISELSMKLSSTEAKLHAYRLRFKEVVDKMTHMDRKYQEASTMLKNQIRTYGQHILDLTKRLAEKD